MSKGRFIVLEGLDGAGSSTQVRLISSFLEGLGFSVHVTREPSRGPFGQCLRKAVEGDVLYPPELLALGYAADRLEHMVSGEGIVSLLEAGIWVVSDRYLPSALAYQAAQGVDYGWLMEINKFAFTPDLTVFIDTPVKTCLERINERDCNKDDLFHKRAALYAIRKEYLKAFGEKAFIGELVTVDGSKPISDVRDRIVKGLVERFRDELGLFAGFAER